jgi:hypothetical protein
MKLLRIALVAALLASSVAQAQTLTDNFGRTVTFTGNAYVVTDPRDPSVGISGSASSQAAAMYVVNSLRPAWYVPTPAPNPTVITSIAFLDRFTPAEQAAVQQAAASAPSTIGVGLTTGLATGTIDLTGPALKAWMDALVTAGAITSARESTILTP